MGEASVILEVKSEAEEKNAVTTTSSRVYFTIDLSVL